MERTTLHWFCTHFSFYHLNEIWNKESSYFFRNTCSFYAAITYSNNESEEFSLFMKVETKPVYKTSGELSTMTSQILTEFQLKDHLWQGFIKLWKFITCEPNIRFCPNFHSLDFLFLLHLLKAHQCQSLLSLRELH